MTHHMIISRSLASALVATSLLLLNIDVVSANGNFCGSTWTSAVSSCSRACPSGAPTECASGETCFANTPCVLLPETPPTPRPVVVQPQQQVNQNQQQQQQNGPWGNPGSYTGNTGGNTSAGGGSGGTCGNGNRGNGICPIPNECCSPYGHCGTSSEHCERTCGAGNRGNGLCQNPNECCSDFGHCGTSLEHCGSSSVGVVGSSPSQSATGGAAPSVYGTCGEGNIGNGICPNNNECCSQYGHCGTSTEHCANKVGNLGPNVPQQQSYNQAPQFQPTPLQSQSAAGGGNQPQFNQNGILVPGTPTQQQQQQSQPQVYGTCGGGQTGNGICPNNNECCSQHGFCGTTLDHCMNKVGPSFPGQPQSTANAGGGAGSNTNPAPGVAPGVNNRPPTTVAYPPSYNTGNTDDNGRPPTTVAYPPSYTNTAGPPGNNWQNGGGQQQQTQPQQTTQSQQGSGLVFNTPAMPHGTNKKIIGYYAGWQWYDRDKLAKPANMDFRKVQRVNYAFFQPDAAGNIYGTDRWGDPQLLFGPYSSKLGGGVQRCSYDGPHEVNCAYHEHNTGIINRAHAVGTEVFPSIGGWTLSDNFPTLSANPVSRDNFAKKCVEILTHHDFDGIDIDWEYPGYAEHSGTPADRENFTKMLSAIRAALEILTRSTGKVYGLTAALPCNPNNIDNIEVGKLSTILTEFNLMSYDFHGAWDEVVGMNAPLYYQGYGNEAFNIHTCVENYVALGVPRERINIGLPFYGRSFKYANALNQQHGGNDLANWPDDDGTPQYFNIHYKLPYMIQMRDNKSKTQYAYISHSQQPPGSPSNPDGLAGSLPEGLVSFDDQRAICDKVQYAQDYRMGGFIIWELSGDMLEDLSTPLLDITNRKLADPWLQCCKLHSEEECEKERLQRESASYSQMGGFDSSSWGVGAPPSSSQRQWGHSPNVSILLSSLVLIAATTVLFC